MILALALSIVPLAYWFHIDHLYPRNDSGQYFFVAQEIYLAFQKWGILRALQTAYLYRAAKPVLEPALELPFIILAGGRVLWARALFGLSFYSLFGSYVCLILGKYLPRASALVLAGVLMSLPWIYHASTSGLPELPFLALLSAAFFHLLSSESLSKGRHAIAFGIFAGLAICARPVEGTLCFIVPVLCLLEGIREWLAVLALAGSTGLSLLAELHIPTRGPDWNHGFPIQAAGLAVFAICMRNARRERWQPLRAITITYCIPMLWFTPFLRDIYSWVVSANFSQVSAITGKRSGWSILDFLLSIPIRIGCNLLFALIIMAAATWIITTRSRFKQALGQASRSFLAKILIGIIVLLPLLGALTNNGDPRYYYSGMVALLALLGVYLLRAPFRKVMVALLVAFWCVQMGFFFAIQAGPEWLANLDWIALTRPQKLWPYTVWTLKPTYVDPAAKPLSEILSQMKPVSSHSVRLAARVAILQLEASNFDHFALGPWEYTIMARERGIADLFEMPWPCGFSDLGKEVAIVGSTYDYLIVGPLNGTPNPATAAAPIARFIADHYENGSINKIGLKVIGLIPTDKNPKDDLLLLQALRRDSTLSCRT